VAAGRTWRLDQRVAVRPEPFGALLYQLGTREQKHEQEEGEPMAGRVEGKVAFITGAARGQGRSHAIRLAQEGADIIAVDICDQVASVPYPMATPEDLAETVKEVETWQDMIDIQLTGMWHACKAAIPHLVAGGRGGSIVITSSDAGLKGFQNLAHYVSAKHGLVGLMRTLALELAPHFIRVNTLHPTTVDTDMIQNEATYRLFLPGVEHPTPEQFAEAAKAGPASRGGQ
jgi:(+)-trans-carveol dehydrogenase